VNESQAKAILRKLYGKGAAWRRNEKALTGEDRAAMIERLTAFRSVKVDAEAATAKRRAELLQDPLYLELLAEERRARDRLKAAQSAVHTRRVTVGYVNDVGGLSFFCVKGEGDNWQEAIDAARGIKPEKGSV
jgi:hypothetical protein